MRRVGRPTVRDEPRKLIAIRLHAKVLSWLRETAEKKGNRRHAEGELVELGKSDTGTRVTASIAQAKKVTETHTSFTAGSLTVSSGSRFSTRHKHPQDSARSVEMFHLFIDLSV